MRIMMMFVVLIAMGATSACTQQKHEDLTSPCVGADDSPCGPRRPINAWWHA